ncbi:hypothetical protein O3P69_010705 [Scylla paramamosain]|uniref:Uncharacterized protein n=1 Tax=Scylla paramamosain TaxID=85552 RepID=A0AAW0TEP2_SCYPA
MSLTPLDEDTSEVQEPERQGVCDTLRHSANWKCFILTLLILACLAAIAWCRLTQVTKVFLDFDTFPITMTRKLSACEDGYLYIPVAFLAMLYLVYLLECFHCPTRMQLTHTTPASHVEAMIEAMRAAQPVIWWKAMCYHYVRRCRHVTRYRNGRRLHQHTGVLRAGQLSFRGYLLPLLKLRRQGHLQEAGEPLQVRLHQDKNLQRICIC